VGDRIEIEKVPAEVVEIKARATILRTNDDIHLIVPNAKFINETIINRTFGRPIYRLHVSVPVASDADPEVVERALIEAARACEGVLDDPAPAVRFREHGESTLRFELLAWTADMVHRPGALNSRLNFLVNEALRRNGVALPSPHLELRVHGNEDAGLPSGGAP